jgi:hypothetical protein
MIFVLIAGSVVTYARCTLPDYLLAEVWLPGEEGFLVQTTKGAHQNQIVKGQKATK